MGKRMRRQLPRCWGKVCYPSEQSASRAAQRCARARGEHLRVYYHEVCESWHLTKQPRYGTMRIDGRTYSFDDENLETWQ